MTKLFSLADQSLAALSNPKRGISMMGEDRKYKPINSVASDQIKKVYKQLRQAVRFVIDDELLHYITHLSVTMDANQALKMMRNTGRLPFPDVWFEWNERCRLDHLNKILNTEQPNGDPIPRRVGYLARELFLSDDEKEEMPICHFTTFFDDEDGKICVPPTGIQMNLQDVYDEFSVDEFSMNVKNQNDIVASMLGGWWAIINEKKRALPKLFKSIKLSYTDAIGWWWANEIPEGADEQIMKFSKHLFAGDARFLIALLATINYTRFVQEPEEIRYTGRKLRYGKNVTGNTYRVLKLTLPKPMGVQVAARKFSDNPSQRRLHDVIGHYVQKKNGLRYWRNAHSRGNKELGKIIKDYELIGG